MEKKGIIKSNNSKKKTVFIVLDWLLSMLGYTVILIGISILFPKTVTLDASLYGFWAFLTAIIVYFLNKTIKPLLVWITIPITALTLGIFYPFINVFILYIVSFIMGSHFTVHGVLMTFLVALLISFLNTMLDHLFFKPLKRKEAR